MKTKLFLIISSIVLVSFTGLRGTSFAGDSQQYAWDYSIYANNFGKGKFEVGFSFLEKLCAWLGFSVTTFFIIIAFLSILFLVLGFEKLAIFPASALLYYYSRFFINRDMNQIRAALAASIILFSLQYLTNKKSNFLKFAFFILLAIVIHKAAFIAFILYPVGYLMNKYIWKSNKRKRIFIYIITLVIAFILSVSCSNIVGNIIGNFDTTYVSRTSDYGKDSYGLANPVIWLQILIGLLTLITVKYEDNEKLKICFSSYFISTILLVLFSNYYVLAGRLSTLLATVEPILILQLIDYCIPAKKWNSNLVSWILFLGISVAVFFIINCYNTQLPLYNVALY
ncbi:EpsG family protein [Limosilactobacillus pontis]